MNVKLFVIPVPIFDKEMAVNAYYFRYQRADNLIIFDPPTHVMDGSINSTLLELLDDMGLDTFTNGKPIFIPISHINLMWGVHRAPHGPSPENIIFRIDGSVTSDTVHLEKIKAYKEEGYRFALRLPADFQNYYPVIELMDYIIVDQKTTKKRDAMELIKKYPDIKSIATHINTYNMFSLSKASGYDLFEGRFYRVPLSLDEKDVTPLKLISIQLIKAFRDENFDIDEVAKIIQKDIALTVSLLRFVNSQRLGLSQKINTISHAAAMLGQLELRKWGSTAASSTLSSDKPNAINKLSLIRAKFAENLAPLFGLAMHSESIFLMGLFSVLDVILDKSIDEALTMVSVSDNIKNALVKHEGLYHPLYEFMLFYEACDWTSVSRVLILNNIEIEDLYNAYISTLTWYRDLITSFSQAED
jgi:EAL and modified HD-GYP domain-containing signal transduction protein